MPTENPSPGPARPFEWTSTLFSLAGFFGLGLMFGHDQGPNQTRSRVMLAGMLLLVACKVYGTTWMRSARPIPPRAWLRPTMVYVAVATAIGLGVDVTSGLAASGRGDAAVIVGGLLVFAGAIYGVFADTIEARRERRRRDAPLAGSK